MLRRVWKIIYANLLSIKNNWELLFALVFSISIVNEPVRNGAEVRETSFPEFDRIFMQLDNSSIFPNVLKVCGNVSRERACGDVLCGKEM